MSQATSFTRTWRRKILTLAAALLTLAGASSQARAQDAQNRIAFDRDGAIYTMNADGTNQTKISGNFGGIDPSYSPDGTKLVFSCGPEWGDICTMNADGTGFTALTSTGDNGNPVFSPDGTKIAFSSARDGYTHVFVMDADGSNVQRPAAAYANVITGDYPSFSPDSTRIAFIGEEEVAPETYVSRLFVARVDGSEAPAAVPLGTNVVEGAAWSPDGSRIAYSDADAIHVVGLDGAVYASLAGGIANYSPAWSPDGSRLAFSRKEFSTDENSSGTTQAGLYVAEVATGAVESLNCPGGSNPAYRPAAQQPEPTPTPTPEPTPDPSAAQRVADLVSLVQSFGVHQGVGHALTVKLNRALDALNDGDAGTACSALSDFINQVRAQTGKKLTRAQAEQLTAEAASIRAAIGCQ